MVERKWLAGLKRRLSYGELQQTGGQTVGQGEHNWARYLMDKYGGAYPSQMAQTWAGLIGLASGPVRPPLLPLTEEERTRLARELVDARREVGLDSPLIPGAL